MKNKKLVTVLDALSVSENAETTFRLLCDYCRDFKIEYIFAGRFSGALTTSDSGLDFFHAQLPAQWTQRYLDKNYVHIDPVITMLMTTTRPFYFEDAYYNLTPTQIQFVEEAADYGWQYGFVVPVHSSCRVPGAVSYASENRFYLTSEETARLWVTTQIAFTRIESFYADARKVKPTTISSRECEILSLVAQGKTNWEVGAILNISEYSVRDYMQGLSRRLQTSNRTHSVTRAIQLGLINI